jgi:hypothetical protein
MKLRINLISFEHHSFLSMLTLLICLSKTYTLQKNNKRKRRFEVFTEVAIKFTVFCDVMTCNPIKVSYFSGDHTASVFRIEN